MVIGFHLIGSGEIRISNYIQELKHVYKNVSYFPMQQTTTMYKLAVMVLLTTLVYAQHNTPSAVHYARGSYHRFTGLQSHPKYTFRYGVHDPQTRDYKEQAEKRDGDKVEGYYKLVEPDGSTRLVQYSANSDSGFRAKVHSMQSPNHFVYVRQRE